MKEYFNHIRCPDKKLTFSKQITHTLLIVVLGIFLGIFSKWLDNMSIDDTIWWQHILGILNLRNIFSEFGIWIFIAINFSVLSSTPLRASLNVFLFFIGMNSSYYLYTILFSGFNPKSYMIIWYTATLLTPVLAYICWYAKGKGNIALMINICITAAMFLSSFGIGMWYFDFKSLIDTLLFIGTVVILYKSPKTTVKSLLGGGLLAFILRLAF